MGRYLNPGHEYVDGQTISGPSLTEHVSEAVLKATAISEQVLKDPAALTDELLINDGGTLKKVTLQQLLNFISSSSALVPIGTVVDYAGPDAPEGWLLCYGQEVSRETYSRLFETIGTTYGAGNGTSSFLLPDLRGRVAAGKDDMGGTTASRFHPLWVGTPYNTGVNGTILGSAGGDALHQLTTAELASHAHSFNDYYVSSTAPGGGGVLQFGNDNHIQETGASTPNTTLNAGSSQHHSNTQPTIILNKIIRYQ